MRQNLLTVAPYRVWSLVDMEWLSSDCYSPQEVFETMEGARKRLGATHVIVSRPGRVEYDGDLSFVNANIAMGRD